MVFDTHIDIWSIISLSELILISLPLYYFIVSKNLLHLVGFIGIIATAGFVEFTKQYILPDWKRPNGAKGCDLLCKSQNDSGKPGMPSGHSAIVAFFGSYYNIQSPFYFLYAALIGISRFKKKCHTIPQILAGYTVGFGSGKLFQCVL